MYTLIQVWINFAWEEADPAQILPRGKPNAKAPVREEEELRKKCDPNSQNILSPSMQAAILAMRNLR